MLNQPESEQRPSKTQPSATARLRLRLWLISCCIGAITWAIVLASLYHFVSNSLPLVDDDSVVALIRDRFLFSFGFTAPPLGALAYFAVLLIAGQQQEVEEVRAKLRQVKAEAQDSQSSTEDSISASANKATQTTEDVSQTQEDSQQEQDSLQKDLVLLLSQQYRTPLTTILSSSELIEKYGADWNKDRIDSHLYRIMASVRTMTALLNNTLLLIGQSEAGALQFEPVVLNLNQFVTDVVQSIETQRSQTQLGNQINAEQEQAHLERRVQCELLAETCSIEGDPRLLRTILENLLSNALQYSPPESLVNLQLSYQEGEATIQIQDRGMGIAKADQESVFQPFFRTQQGKTVSGCGLGLAIAQVCTKLHGGAIALESTEGQGTTVTVTLPLPLQSTSSTTASE